LYASKFNGTKAARHLQTAADRNVAQTSVCRVRTHAANHVPTGFNQNFAD
jgi:hypothetical protein